MALGTHRGRSLVESGVRTAEMGGTADQILKIHHTPA
jgi:hypothetical protein